MADSEQGLGTATPTQSQRCLVTYWGSGASCDLRGIAWSLRCGRWRRWRDALFEVPFGW